jgi:hypothetical protein
MQSAGISSESSSNLRHCLGEASFASQNDDVETVLGNDDGVNRKDEDTGEPVPAIRKPKPSSASQCSLESSTGRSTRFQKIC